MITHANEPTCAPITFYLRSQQLLRVPTLSCLKLRKSFTFQVTWTPWCQMPLHPLHPFTTFTTPSSPRLHLPQDSLAIHQIMEGIRNLFYLILLPDQKKDTSQNLNWSGYLLPWKMDKRCPKICCPMRCEQNLRFRGKELSTPMDTWTDTWTHDEVLLAKILLTSSRSLGLETKPQCHMLQSPPDGQDWWSSGHKQWKKG